MQVEFHKMHGLGNDFIIFKDSIQFESLPADQVKQLCDRKYGVGCDQLIICNKLSDNHVKMEIYNNDGSLASFCGNATRCVVALYKEDSIEKDILIEAGNRLLKCCLKNEMVTVNIGEPILSWDKIPLSFPIEGNEIDLPIEIQAKKLKGFCVNVGNPHVVIFVENYDFDLVDVGSKIENLHYFPHKTNVNFANVINKNNINLRVWERGSGLTLACGSGASASFYAAFKMNLVENDCNIHFEKGWLNIKLENGNIIMTGSYTYVFKGNVKIKDV